MRSAAADCQGSCGWTELETAWGTMGLVGRGALVTGVHLPDTPATVRAWIAAAYPRARFDKGLAAALQAQLRRYFAGDVVTFAFETNWARFRPFTRRVLRACRRIALGATVSYGQLARRVGVPGAGRAVGQVMARNPLPLLIPCHRVLAGDGSLGGYSGPGGTAFKQRLLDHERAMAARAGGDWDD